MKNIKTFVAFAAACSFSFVAASAAADEPAVRLAPGSTVCVTTPADGGSESGCQSAYDRLEAAAAQIRAARAAAGRAQERADEAHRVGMEAQASADSATFAASAAHGRADEAYALAAETREELGDLREEVAQVKEVTSTVMNDNRSRLDALEPRVGTLESRFDALSAARLVRPAFSAGVLSLGTTEEVGGRLVLSAGLDLPTDFGGQTWVSVRGGLLAGETFGANARAGLAFGLGRHWYVGPGVEANGLTLQKNGRSSFVFTSGSVEVGGRLGDHLLLVADLLPVGAVVSGKEAPVRYAWGAGLALGWRL